jgi:hypothetical protein
VFEMDKFDIFIGDFLILVFVVLITYGALMFNNKFTIQYTIQGKVSDVKYIQQGLATDFLSDATEVTFYSGNTIRFIGNQLNLFQMGSNYNIVYHQIFFKNIGVYNEIISVEKLVG